MEKFKVVSFNAEAQRRRVAECAEMLCFGGEPHEVHPKEPQGARESLARNDAALLSK